MTAPILAWNFDEDSGPVLDRTGNGHDLTLSGTVTRTAGHTGQGLVMSSLSEAFTGGLGVPAQPEARTVALWVQDSSAASDGRVLEWYRADGDVSIFRLAFRATEWHVQVWNASTYGRATITRPTDHAPHHVAATYDGVLICLYLDGVLAASAPFAGPIRTDATSFRTLYNTGAGIVVDDARVYAEALSGDAVASLMGVPVTDPPPPDSGGGEQAPTAVMWSDVAALMWGR